MSSAAAEPGSTGPLDIPRIHGRRLLEQITHQLISTDHLQALANRDKTAAAVVKYLEAAVADLDDARTLLEHHLKGLG